MLTNVYVDGFNLYYGALRRSPWKWLNIEALCRAMLQKHHVIGRIRYFTALVTPRQDNPQQHNRQQAYLRALQTLPNVTVHRGAFLTNEKDMPLASPPQVGSRMVRVISTTEKGSDVNLASYLLIDGFRKEYEAAVVISNDSDLCTPIKFVRDELKLHVGILNPHAKPAWELKKVAKFQLPITQEHLRASQFPSKITDANGEVTKPTRW